MKEILCLLLFCLGGISLQAQLSGVVTDANGHPLQSASIYISGTTIGVNSNAQGAYLLSLPPGQSDVIFQYIGYKSETRRIRNEGKPIVLDIKLDVQSFEISEIEINASSEDPAYQIIRNAIDKREFYKNQIKSYECDVYIKGNQKIIKIPNKILGQEVGTLDGILDTNRQGIVYLSESLSKYYYQQPNQIKEELISSKVSGNSRGFSFNRAREMRFNLYEPSIGFGKQIISPISNGAFLFYKYKLEGSFFDQEGRQINKIKVIPRNDNSPVFRGDIFIYENTWNIHSCHLAITSKTINQEILDTLWLNQQYVPTKENDQWVILSQNIDFGIKFIGIHIKGFFTAVYSNYELNKSYPENFFSDELLKIDVNSNKRDQQYWDTIRPIPLMQEEKLDFTKKDSLEIIWNSKEFKDSTDRKSNKFNSNNILFGYTYRNTFERWSLSIGSPLSTIQFDPVRGFYTAMAIKYKKEQNEEATSWYSISPELSYGFADKKLRASLEFQKLFNKINYQKIILKAGHIAEQYNDANPISPTINGLYNLYAKLNYLKLYDKKFLRIGLEQRFLNKLKFESFVDVSSRTSLLNNTNYSFKKKDLDYSPNYPGDTIGGFVKHKAAIFLAKLEYSPGTKYVSYPNYRVYLAGKAPVFGLQYRIVRAFNFETEEKQSYFLHNPQLSFEYNFNPKFIGNSSIRALLGTNVFSGGKPEIIDYKHFNGNQTILNPEKSATSAFRLLLYYDYSTLGNYFEFHLNHNFNGFFLGKIPLIKNLKLEENIGAKLLLLENDRRYSEYSIGISNIGWSIFRLFRIDYTWAFRNDSAAKNGVTIGISLNN